jgi:hypothetical protein
VRKFDRSEGDDLPLSTKDEERQERKMKIRYLGLVFIAALCFPVMAMGQTAIYNYAGGVNFAEYKTYKWVNIEGAAATDQALDQGIKQAIDAQLAAKGLVKSQEGAQLYVGYQISFRREKQIAQYRWGGSGGYGPGWRYGYNFGYDYGDPAMSTATSSTIQLGNLVLDIYDSGYKDLVWRGSVSNAFGPDQKKYNLDKATATLLKNYPPKSKK